MQRQGLIYQRKSAPVDIDSLPKQEKKQIKRSLTNRSLSQEE